MLGACLPSDASAQLFRFCRPRHPFVQQLEPAEPATGQAVIPAPPKNTAGIPGPPKNTAGIPAPPNNTASTQAPPKNTADTQAPPNDTADIAPPPKKKTADKEETDSASPKYKVVSTAPQYHVPRVELPTGARITLFSSFLGDRPGLVVMDMAATSMECSLVEWSDNAVTIELPGLGLSRPVPAEIRIFRSAGRVAKTVSILLVPQPDIIVHEETIAAPLPPPPPRQTASFIWAARGGLMLQATR